MINIAGSNTKLNILLNNTNKALAQVLIDATQDELKSITKEGSDLRSIMAKILKQTTTDITSNKAMLTLVKNNPTLKNLGDATITIKELIKSIKSDKHPLPIEKVLKNALIDIKDIKSSDIKPKLDNSGVFLESKIKNIQNPIQELKTNLASVKEILQESKLPQVKPIIKDVEVLVKNSVIKNATNADLVKDIKHNPKTLETISKEVKIIVDKLQKSISSADPIHTSKAKEVLNKLEFATTATQTKNVSIREQSTPFKQQTSQVNITKAEMLAQKPMPPVQVAIEKVSIEKATIEKMPLDKLVTAKLEIDKTQQNKITADIPKALEVNKPKLKIQVPLPAQSVLDAKAIKFTPVLNTPTIQTQTALLDDTSLKSPLIKESLQALQSILDKSLTMDSKPLLRALTTILKSITSSSESTSPEIKQDLSKLIQDTKLLMQKADVVHSKDMLTIFSKLKDLSLAPNLSQEQRVKEMLGNDLKATLLQTTEELQNSSNPNKNDLIKQMDKLVLQIDHYQLISHLSNGTSVYLPITWDQLEGGNLDIKKDNDKFYCDIDLQLKDYGEVSLKLTLFEKNQINIHVYSKSQELKDLFQEHLSILRSGLIGTQIVPREIRFHDGLDKNLDKPYDGDDDFKMGFEVRG